MKKHHFTLLLAFTLCNLSGKYTTTYAQKPMGKVTFIEARKVHIDDSFWSPKMELWKRVTIDDVLNKFEGKHVNEPGNHNTLSNFDRVTQGCTGTGGHVGPPLVRRTYLRIDPRHCRLPDIISRQESGSTG